MIKRNHFRVLAVIFCLILSGLLMLSSTGAAWAGKVEQTIPTVTATVEGQPTVALPDGITSDNPIVVQAEAGWSQYGIWSIGCCLLLCLLGLIPIGLLFNIWARRRRTPGDAK